MKSRLINSVWNSPLRRLVASGVLATASLCLFSAVVQAETPTANWAGFRGPQGDGHSADPNLPTTWGTGDIKWSQELPGEGQSSPCIYGEQIFLTASQSNGRERVLMCLNRNDGRVQWQHTVWTGDPEPVHKMTGWAAATPACDGERVYAFFGRGGGLFCYALNGEKLWQQELGEFEGPWGTAASPVIVGDVVVQNCDADTNASIMGFNKLTGKVLWKTPRDNFRGWSTPLLQTVNGRQELVLNGHTGAYGYDPQTGKQLWFCKGDNGRGSPAATPGPDGLVYIVCGRPGNMFAVRTGGSGDVTASRRVWEASRRSRDLPAPIVVDNQLLVVDMKGIITAYDTKTGKEVYKQRIGGNYSAAPVAFKGHAFFLNEAGETVVVKPGKELNIVAKNDVGAGQREVFRAAISPSDGQLFIRSTGKLYCIGQRTAK